ADVAAEEASRDGATGAAGATGAGGASGALSFDPVELVTSVSLSVSTTGVVKSVTLHNWTSGDVSLSALAIQGPDAAVFVVEGAPALPKTLAAGADLVLAVRFLPAAGAAATTAYGARVTATAGGLDASAGLYGLAMNAANAEPSLDQVVRTLGYAVDVGSKTTSLGTAAALIGEEIAAPRFTRAHEGVVTVQPVARYSPFEAAPFGFYTGAAPAVVRTALGVMSKGAADNIANRTLFPPLDVGA